MRGDEPIVMIVLGIGCLLGSRLRTPVGRRSVHRPRPGKVESDGVRDGVDAD